ncbi:MAG: FG-GAP-like repeat-containing protein [Nitrosomonas sp.]
MSDPIFTLTPTNPFGLRNVGSFASSTLIDIDGDRDLDVFVGKGDGNTAFFRNVGTVNSPIFAASSTNPFGLSDVGALANPTFVDIDGDGDLDAFVGNGGFYSSNGYYDSLGGDTLFFRNIGTTSNPKFATAVTNPFGLSHVGFGANPTFVDIDGDGDLDAFIGNGYFGGSTLFFRNIGTVSNPKFSTASSNPFGLIGLDYYASPTFADIDSDGDLDALLGEGSGNTVFQRNIGSKSTPIFAAASFNSLGLIDVGYSAEPTFVDIDGDGDQDAFIGNRSGDVIFFRNTGTANNPFFATPVTNPFNLSDVGDTASPTFVDIDDDGDQDAFVGNHDSDTLFFRNVGTASIPIFAPPEADPFGLNNGGSYGANPAFADIDGDGDFDAFVGNIFFKNTGTVSNPVFAGEYDLFGFIFGFDINPTLVDIEGDGDFDMFVGYWYREYTSMFFLENTGTANEPHFEFGNYNPYGLSFFGINGASFVDIDNDGDLDAFQGNWNGNTVFQRNIGTLHNPKFAPADNALGLIDVGNHATPSLGDIDGDGDLDAFVGNNSGDIQFFVNNGLLLVSTAGNNTLTGTPSNNDTATYAAATKSVTVSLLVNTQQNTIGAGLDTLISIENLTGSAFNDRLTGNTLNNVLDGKAGNDTLRGWSGADTMIGGLGNDTYFVENAKDIVTEKLNEGTDIVSSNVIYTLPVHVENLTLTGVAAINGTGNSQNNIITGNSAANQLDGGSGNDTLDGGLGVDKLTGGRGNDVFKFTTKGHIDIITDFNVTNDTIQLENAVFKSLTATGMLAASQFKLGTKALDANDFIIYNKATGALLYDADGNGGGAAVQITTVGAGLNMTNADIVVI